MMRYPRIVIFLWMLCASGLSSSNGVTSESGVPYLISFQEQTPILPNNEIRALWVVRDAMTSKQRIDHLVDFAIRGRFQMLFAQVRGRGDAYYDSRIEPEARDLELPISDFDPLQYLLVRAHEVGLSVHAWVNVYYVWSDPHTDPPPGHVIRRHPEWLITDPEGIRMSAREVDAWKGEGVEGYFLSPDNPDARAFTVRIIEDIVTRYSIDGLHLDYVRYPAPAFGFDVEDRRNFALLWGVDPLGLLRNRDYIGEVVGQESIALLDSLIIEKRVHAVDSLVLAVRKVVTDIPLSAAVIPDPDRARIEKGQDWIRWIQRRYLDFVVLMAYSYHPPELKRRVHLVQNLIGREKFLVGLPLYDGRAIRLEYAVSSLRDVGVLGFSLFSYNVMEGQRYAVQFLNKVFFGEVEERESH